MPKPTANNVVSFHELQGMRDWVREVFAKHTGVYVLEQDGFVQIWLVNPDILDDLPEELAAHTAQVIDEVTTALLSETRLLPELAAVFGGRLVDAKTCETIASYVAEKLNDHRVGRLSVQDRLEHAIVQTLYTSVGTPLRSTHI